MNLNYTVLAAALLLNTSIALAQNKAPATADPADDDKEGTTVMGDRESPIGLLIAPWREATAEKDLDRPVRFLQEELIPLDAEVFRRQIEYYNTISSHLRARGVPGYTEDISVSPLAASAAPTTPPAPAQ